MRNATASTKILTPSDSWCNRFPLVRPGGFRRHVVCNKCTHKTGVFSHSCLVFFSVLVGIWRIWLDTYGTCPCSKEINCVQMGGFPLLCLAFSAENNLRQLPFRINKCMELNSPPQDQPSPKPCEERAVQLQIEAFFGTRIRLAARYPHQISSSVVSSPWVRCMYDIQKTYQFMISSYQLIQLHIPLSLSPPNAFRPSLVIT